VTSAYAHTSGSPAAGSHLRLHAPRPPDRCPGMTPTSTGPDKLFDGPGGVVPGVSVTGQFYDAHRCGLSIYVAYAMASGPHQPYEQRNHGTNHQHVAQHSVVGPNRTDPAIKQRPENQMLATTRRAMTDEPCHLSVRGGGWKPAAAPSSSRASSLSRRFGKRKGQPAASSAWLGHVPHNVAALVAQQLSRVGFHGIPQIEPRRPRSCTHPTSVTWLG
jgi:hypothetical protein